MNPGFAPTPYRSGSLAQQRRIDELHVRQHRAGIELHSEQAVQSVREDEQSDHDGVVGALHVDLLHEISV